MDRIQIVLDSLNVDSSFVGRNSSYATHNFHAFAAKFPPQIPRLFIEHLTEKGETVLDPMVGSGTSVVEALLLGRKGIAFDIDPLAVHLSKIKTSGLNYDQARYYFNKVIIAATKNVADDNLINHEFDIRFDDETKDFVDYWFTKESQRELLSLVIAIETIDDELSRDFYKLVFSSIIITKSGGVSLARDLAHSRPHKDKQKVPKNALDIFSARLNKLLPGLHQIPNGSDLIRIEQGDARKLSLTNESIDLIITSPPYANAIDYMRAHKFSLVWLGKSISDLSSLRPQYIGSEKITGTPVIDLPALCQHTIGDVEALDSKKAKILNKYFTEMHLVLGEMKRVLKHNKYCALVVGNSTMRGYQVPTNKNIEELGEHIGLKIIGNIVRKLDRDKRMMPASFSRNNSGIEQRMHEEYIIIFQKP